MAERSKAAVLKTVIPVRVSWVRIPLSPPYFAKASYGTASPWQLNPNPILMNITLTQVTSQQLKELLTTTDVLYGYHQLPVGTLFICTLNNNIIAAVFCDDSTTTEETILKKYPHAQLCDDQHLTQLINQPTLNIITTGTDFQYNVWRAAAEIPAGTTATYQELATKLNNPTAFRAVANALADNSVAYFIPCHRIVRSNGDMGGYKWGFEVKAALLEHERATKKNQ